MKLYEDLDELPILNWFKVHETGDLSWLMKNRKSKSQSEKLKTHWKELYDMYITAFGFSDHFLKVLKKEAEIALLMIKKAETGNETLQTFIEIKQHQLKLSQQASSKADFYQIKGVMDKFFGFGSNSKKMSVMEFYSNIKLMENAK